MREANLTLPFTSVPQQVNVEVVDGVVVVGGDMVLGPEAILSQPQPNATSRGGAAIRTIAGPITLSIMSFIADILLLIQ
jgi:hypothetical protein